MSIEKIMRGQQPGDVVYRDIQDIEVRDSVYVWVTLTCGHEVRMTQHRYRKFHLDKDEQVACLECTRAAVRNDQ